MGIRAVLWDADGVLQDLPTGDPVFPALGAERSAALVSAVFGPLPDLLAGRLDMAGHLEAQIAEHGVQDQRAHVYELWNRDAPVEAARRLLAEVRAAGTRCVLATNQDTLRAEHMRDRYAGLLDAAYFSCDLATAKPERSFFAAIGAAEGLRPEEMLLIDDAAANVVGAREAGLAAVGWHHQDGIDVLRGLLAEHAVP